MSIRIEYLIVFLEMKSQFKAWVGLKIDRLRLFAIGQEGKWAKLASMEHLKVEDHLMKPGSTSIETAPFQVYGTLRCPENL